MQENPENVKTTRPGAAESTQLLKTIPAAAELGISKRGLQELVADRKIGFIKINRSIRFHRDDIAKFIEAHRCQPVGWKSANRGGAA
jgi:excisionase family DNA binding protein